MELRQVTRAMFITKVGPGILVGFMLWSSCSAFKSERRPHRYLFPEGYIGWVRVNFKKDAPLPPLEDGFYVLTFPPSGEVVISNNTQFEDGGIEFYYYSADMRLTRMHPTSAGSVNVQDSDNLEEPRHYQFVGTYEEYLFYNSRFPYDEEDEHGLV